MIAVLHSLNDPATTQPTKHHPYGVQPVGQRQEFTNALRMVLKDNSPGSWSRCDCTILQIELEATASQRTNIPSSIKTVTLRNVNKRKHTPVKGEKSRAGEAPRYRESCFSAHATSMPSPQRLGHGDVGAVKPHGNGWRAHRRLAGMDHNGPYRALVVSLESKAALTRTSQ